MSQDPRRENMSREPKQRPEAEQPDWERELRRGITPESIADDSELQLDEPDGALPEEDDDNPYQDSDAALPDDLEERVISRNPGKEGSRFDEI